MLTGPCLSDDDLVALSEGTMTNAGRERALDHADTCPECHALIAAVGTGSPVPGDDEAEPLVLERGVTVGRYLIIGFLGAGAMGEVHAAYDPELDRRVALKLISAGRGPTEGQRLAREAQAMARLAHPNVVAVYDTGSWIDRIFIAMELVEGKTLRAWLDDGPHPWPSVLGVLVEAGRGLAAAHAVGVIHRDFKPDNVLLGKDGRARVADFGVARANRAAAPAHASSPPAELTVTQAGSVIGTPAYMAPEVLAGGEATARSDQFSFCVALYEALYRRRPFDIGPQQIIDPEARRAPSSPPRGAAPARLRRVVLRGLSHDPAARWPSMEALLAALMRDPARPWRRAALAAGVAALLAVFAYHARPRASGCELAGAPVVAVWDAAARERVRQAFSAAGAPGAERALASFTTALDGWTAGWREARTAACAATRVDETQSEALLDRRVVCYDRQLDQLRSVIEIASQPAAQLVDRAIELAGRLPPASRCEARVVLEARVVDPPDPATARRADALRLQLNRADALLGAGRYDEALVLLERLAGEARGLDHPPVEARALRLLGRALHDRRRPAEAAARLGQAQRLAIAAGDDLTAAEAMVNAVFVVGVMLGKAEDGEELGRAAEMLVRRLGEAALGADLDYYRGILQYEAGALEGARARFTRALADERRLRGPDHPFVGFALDGLAHVSLDLDDWEGARRAYDQALAIADRTFGRLHPRAMGILNNYGVLHLNWTRQYALALAFFEASGTAQGGTETDELGLLLCNQADAWYRLGRHTEALGQARRGLSLIERGGGPEHPLMADCHAVVAGLLDDLDRPAEAAEHRRRALAILRKNRGDDHVETAEAALRLAAAQARASRAVDLSAARAAIETLSRRGRPKGPRLAAGAALLCRTQLLLASLEGADFTCARAIEAAELSLPVDHPDRALSWLAWGELNLARGRVTGALGGLERAALIMDRHVGDVVLGAEVRFALARALIASGGDRPRARSLAEAARAALLASVGGEVERVRAIDRWVASTFR